MNRTVATLLTFVAGLVLGGALTLPAEPAADTVRDGESAQEAGVTGIGGVFFKARDPAALRAWYRDHLGIDAGEMGTTFLWREAHDPELVGRTVWSVFPEGTDYFGDGDQGLMVNYRVADMDATLAALAERGVLPVKEPESYPYGTFAWIEDGEGNRIELWEPPVERAGAPAPAGGR